jgi:hypothetical protein
VPRRPLLAVLSVVLVFSLLASAGVPRISAQQDADPRLGNLQPFSAPLDEQVPAETDGEAVEPTQASDLAVSDALIVPSRDDDALLSEASIEAPEEGALYLDPWGGQTLLLEVISSAELDGDDIVESDSHTGEGSDSEEFLAAAPAEQGGPFSISPSSGPPGTTVTATVTGNPGARVTIQDPRGTAVASGTVAQNGQFSARLQVPQNAAVGEYRFQATVAPPGAGLGAFYFASFAVTGAMTTGPTTTTAQPCPLPAVGEVINLQGNADLYVYLGGALHRIPDPETLNSRFASNPRRTVDSTCWQFINSRIQTHEPIPSVRSQQWSGTVQITANGSPSGVTVRLREDVRLRVTTSTPVQAPLGIVIVRDTGEIRNDPGECASSTSCERERGSEVTEPDVRRYYGAVINTRLVNGRAPNRIDEPGVQVLARSNNTVTVTWQAGPTTTTTATTRTSVTVQQTTTTTTTRTTSPVTTTTTRTTTQAAATTTTQATTSQPTAAVVTTTTRTTTSQPTTTVTQTTTAATTQTQTTTAALTTVPFVTISGPQQVTTTTQTGSQTTAAPAFPGAKFSTEQKVSAFNDALRKLIEVAPGIIKDAVTMLGIKVAEKVAIPITGTICFLFDGATPAGYGPPDGPLEQGSDSLKLETEVTAYQEGLTGFYKCLVLGKIPVVKDIRRFQKFRDIDTLLDTFEDPPDPNFRVAAEPIPVEPIRYSADGDLPADLAEALNAWAENQERQMSLRQAILTAVERSQGAAIAGDAQWESQHTAAARRYSAELATLLYDEPRLAGQVLALSDQTETVTFTVTAADLRSMKSAVLEQGLGSDFVQELIDSGLDEAAIQRIARLVTSVNPDEIPSLTRITSDEARAYADFARSGQSVPSTAPSQVPRSAPVQIPR